MKKFNKVLAVALAVLMMAMTAVPAFADYWALSLEEELYIEVPRRGNEVWVFVPDYDGCFTINTYSLEEDPNADPVITVYDAYDNEIAYSDDYWDDIDYAALVEFYGEAGEVATLKVETNKGKINFRNS